MSSHLRYTTLEAELPPCWQLAGAEGSSRLQRTINKTLPAEVSIACSAGTSYKRTKVFAYQFDKLVYKWEYDPGYLPADGCRRLHSWGTFSYRAELSPESTPLQWEYWKITGFDTLLASGFGREFSQPTPAAFQGTLLVRFFIDCTQNLQYDPGEPELSSEFYVNVEEPYPVTGSRHVQTSYTISEFESHLYGASGIARRRDRYFTTQTGGDVHCRVSIFRTDHQDGSSFKTFGTTGDGLNNAWWIEINGVPVPGSGNIDQVFGQPGTYKIVDSITCWDGGVPTQIPGVKHGGSIVIEASAADVVYLHELMHLVTGVNDRNDNPAYIMYWTTAPPKDSLDMQEADLLE